jgi:hypothetical protein
MATKVSLHRVTKVTKEIRHVESEMCGPFTTTELTVETEKGEELVITLYHRGELKVE